MITQLVINYATALFSDVVVGEKDIHDFRHLDPYASSVKIDFSKYSDSAGDKSLKNPYIRAHGECIFKRFSSLCRFHSSFHSPVIEFVSKSVVERC